MNVSLVFVLNVTCGAMNGKPNELLIVAGILKPEQIFGWSLQALKANPSLAPKEVKISSNYITKFGQVALMEALDMVYEMSGDQREIVIHF